MIKFPNFLKSPLLLALALAFNTNTLQASDDEDDGHSKGGGLLSLFGGGSHKSLSIYKTVNMDNPTKFQSQKLLDPFTATKSFVIEDNGQKTVLSVSARIVKPKKINGKIEKFDDFYPHLSTYPSANDIVDYMHERIKKLSSPKIIILKLMPINTNEQDKSISLPPHLEKGKKRPFSETFIDLEDDDIQPPTKKIKHQETNNPELKEETKKTQKVSPGQKLVIALKQPPKHPISPKDESEEPTESSLFESSASEDDSENEGSESSEEQSEKKEKPILRSKTKAKKQIEKLPPALIYENITICTQFAFDENKRLFELHLKTDNSPETLNRIPAHAEVINNLSLRILYLIELWLESSLTEAQKKFQKEVKQKLDSKLSYYR